MGGEKYLPGVWSKFWTYFKLSRNADKSVGQLKYKGEDLNGNVFFESTDQFGRVVRQIEPKNSEPSALKCLPEINTSPEWIRWLRKNRDDPPTEEEILRNAAIAYLAKQRAAELEAEERRNWPELDAKLKQLEEERNYNPITFFPMYRDLELKPGQEYANTRGFYRPDLGEMEQEQQQQQLTNGESNKLLPNEKVPRLAAEDTGQTPTQATDKAPAISGK